MIEIITAKVTSKGQVTIPKKVRETLEIVDGDSISYEVHESTAVIKKVPRLDVEWAKSVENTLTEWSDELDDEL